mmetsp:Transcript_1289/g.2911  ORF Transcript_1289/g.2911 Transcript_1289/m.2911 type:complete len:354 (-) Transcript_1289:2637-3698(-)
MQRRQRCQPPGQRVHDGRFPGKRRRRSVGRGMVRRNGDRFFELPDGQRFSRGVGGGNPGSQDGGRCRERNRRTRTRRRARGGGRAVREPGQRSGGRPRWWHASVVAVLRFEHRQTFGRSRFALGDSSIPVTKPSRRGWRRGDSRVCHRYRANEKGSGSFRPRIDLSSAVLGSFTGKPRIARSFDSIVFCELCHGRAPGEIDASTLGHGRNSRLVPFDSNRKRRCRPIGYLVLEELFFSLRESESRGILSAARETERNPENGNRVLPRRGRESFERRQRRRFIGSRRFRRRTGAERRGFVVRDSIGAQHGRYNRDNEIYQRRHRPCRDSCRNPPEPKQQADGLRTNPSRSNLGL